MFSRPYWFQSLYLLTLPLIWIALQHGFKGVTAAIVALNSGVVLALWLFRFDLTRLSELELLMIVNCIVGLLMGAVVTERKQAEEALQENEEKYRILVDEVNDGFYVCDGTGVFTFANPALARIYGVESPQALVGRKFSDFLAPEIPAVLDEAYSSAMQTGSAQEIMNGQIIRPDGTCAFIEFKPTMIVKGGQIVGTRGVVRDITGRKHREEEIRSRTEELTTLYQLSRALSDANGLENVIELVSRHAVESVRSTFAFILLLEDGELVSQPVYPIRNLGHDFNISDRQPITALPICQRVMNKNEPVVLQAGSPEFNSAERAALLR